MTKLRWLPIFLLPFLASCLPIELDVNKDGEMIVPRQEGFFLFDTASGKVTKVLGNEDGEPVFAKFSPDGKDIVTVVKGDSDFAFRISPKTGGEPRQVFSAANATYVNFSPDGKYLAISNVASEKKPPLDDQMPKITLVRVADGRAKELAGNVSQLMRWFSDSKRMLVFDVTKKDEDDNYHGQIAVLDVITGKSTPLASSVGSKDVYFDLSPDNRRALFMAYAADKAGTELKKGDSSSQKLFELDIEKGTVRAIDKEARYAIYSPDGKQVLLGTPPEGFSLEGLKLEVAPSDLSTFKTVAPDAAMPLAVGGEGTVYPGWAGNNRIHYFVERKVYGTSGKSLHLVLISDKGADKQWPQPKLDAKALESAK